ncbi:MAG: phage major tail tube protein [Zoogloeaceae bacterium]|jgi:P2 family phage contractile tail tube protein|nr:phage major tail tube protein [Zoogloeaceae bacterium]
MAMPRKLKNFNVFYNGDNYIGRCSEVELPKLTRKTEDLQAGGMNGPVKVDLGNEGLEINHTYAGFEAEIFRQYAAATADSVLLRFAGAYQRDDTGDVDAVEIVARGRHTEIDLGSAKAGDDTELKVKSDLSYYKLSVNGETLVEIDLLNFVENIGGADLLSGIRSAIGL